MIHASSPKAVLLTVLLVVVGMIQPLGAQDISVDSASTAARGRLRGPATPPDSSADRDRAVPDSLRRQGSRFGAAALGFLAGAAVGLVVAHAINENQSEGEGRLENYIGIPLGLGLVTFFTVFVAKGD